MKTPFKYIFLLSLSILALTGFSQINESTFFNGKRSITAEGKSEVKAEIDIIKVSIILSDEFCAGPKQNMNTLTEKFEANLKSVGYSMSDAKLISEETADLGYTNANNSTVMIVRKYEVVFKAARHYFTFKNLMPSSGMAIEFTEIGSSKMDATKKEGLALAYKDAKSKAEALLEIAGGKIGNFLMIIQREPYDWAPKNDGYDINDTDATEIYITEGLKIESTVVATFEVN